MSAYEYLPNEYNYPHTLDADDPNMRDPLSAPILRAAFRVMEYAHRNPDGTPSSRGKINESIPYTSHTVLVYRLLAAMGETDPIILAAALLHDALEDCKPEFSENPQAMHDKLAYELIREGFGIKEANKIAGEITTICAQVKNTEIRKIHKANAQMQEVPFMGHEAKILKIADQAASLYCHLVMPDAARTKYDDSAFAHKAQNVVRKIVHHPTAFENGKKRPTLPEERRDLSRWDHLFLQIYRLNARLLRAKTQEEEVIAREHFKQRQPYLVRGAIHKHNPLRNALKLDDEGIERTIDLLKQYNVDGVPEHGLLPPHQCGVSRISLNAHGEVMRFTVWAAPESTTKHPRNLTLKLVSELIAAHPVGLLHIDDSELHSVLLQMPDGSEQRVKEGQRFIFESPMPVKDFLDKAMHASAITDADYAHVLALAKPSYVSMIEAQYRTELGGNTLGR